MPHGMSFTSKLKSLPKKQSTLDKISNTKLTDVPTKAERLFVRSVDKVVNKVKNATVGDAAKAIVGGPFFQKKKIVEKGSYDKGKVEKYVSKSAMMKHEKKETKSYEKKEEKKIPPTKMKKC